MERLGQLETYAGDYAAALALLLAPRFSKAGHDVKNFQREMLELGTDALANWVFDAALAGYLLDSTASGYDLDRLCLAYCGFSLPEPEADEGQMSLSLDGEDEKARLAKRMGALTSRAAAAAALEEAMTPRLA